MSNKIKKITQKEVKEVVKVATEYMNKSNTNNIEIYFFISNNTLYKEMHIIGTSLSNAFEIRDYIPTVKMDEDFIFNKEHTMIDNIRDIQLNVNEMVEKYNKEHK